MLFKSLLIAATASIAAAQGTQIQTVRVGMFGNGTTGNIYSPDRVTAAVGSIVQFQFVGGNHTITQSTFDGSCIPISTTNTSAIGFYSGFIFAQASFPDNVATYSIVINSTNPIWIYCSQGRHCQNGMAMVINENPTANSTRTLEQYKLQASSVQQAGVPTISPGAGGVAGTGTIDPNNPGATQPTQPGAAAGLKVPMALLAALAGGVMLL